METHLILMSVLSLCCLSFGQECSPELLEDVDFPGTDIKNIFAADVEHCQKLCTQHPSCLFFTFIRADWTQDSRNFFCYIKSTPSGKPNTQTDLKGVTSGFSLKPCNRDSELGLYRDIDFYGADYRTLFTHSYEECQRVCTQDPFCQFFTHVNKDFATAAIRYKCHLKFSWTIPRTPIVNRQAGLVSGFSHNAQVTQKSGPECQEKLLANTNIPGSTVLELPAGFPQHCQALCSAHPLCTYFSYSSDALTCYLKSNPDKMVTTAAEGVTSGIKTHSCRLDISWLKTPLEGVDFLASDIRFVLMDDPETCQITCTNDPHCQFYTYVTAQYPRNPVYRRRCYLKRVITMPNPPTIKKLDNVVSGFSLRNLENTHKH